MGTRPCVVSLGCHVHLEEEGFAACESIRCRITAPPRCKDDEREARDYQQGLHKLSVTILWIVGK